MHRSQFRQPSPALEPYIRFYVQREARIRVVTVLHPVPARASAMIVFDFDDPTNVLYSGHSKTVQSPKTVIVGPQTYRRLEMQLRGSLNTFVIVFQPDGIHKLFSIPMPEISDLDFEAHSVLGPSISHLAERLGNARSFPERIRLVEEAFLPPALASTGQCGVSHAAHQVIFAGGRVGIPALAARSGLSLRQFERRFIQQVGMRPKLFARISRFEAALEEKARSAQKPWTQVAHEFGYYDQMHMIHDFAEFTGTTPTETLTQLETVFVEQIRAIRSSGPSIDPDRNKRLIL